MEVKVRPLNRGETFCCSVKTAKEMFKNTDIYLDFAYLGRNYRTWAETPDAYYWKRNVKGRILATMQTRSGEARPICIESNVLCSVDIHCPPITLHHL